MESILLVFLLFNSRFAVHSRLARPAIEYYGLVQEASEEDLDNKVGRNGKAVVEGEGLDDSAENNREAGEAAGQHDKQVVVADNW